MIKRLLVIPFLLQAVPAAADCSSAWRACEDVTISRLVTSGDGANTVRISGNLANLTCTPVLGGYLRIDMSGAQAQSLYSHILSLHLQGKRISVRMSEQIQECTIIYVWSEG